MVITECTFQYTVHFYLQSILDIMGLCLLNYDDSLDWDKSYTWVHRRNVWGGGGNIYFLNEITSLKLII